MYYNVCNNCGAHLDPSEQCTCKELERNNKMKYDGLLVTDANGQLKLGGRQLKITKIKIKNLFGISEYEADGNSVELSGENGTGKTSVIDAIRYALTNKSDRDYIVKNGETEGEIIIETDTGLSIRRKPRTNQADFKSVKRNGAEVGSPETFLKDIFTELQLSPVEFMDMDKKEQNRIILNMIEFDWDMAWIKEQFGEIPPDVNYEQNILSVLSDIQSENGFYYQKRQELGREKRNKKSFIEEIGDGLPAGYDADKWENENLGELYKEIETIRSENETIERAKRLLENRDNKVRKFEADREIAIAALDREFSATRESLLKENERLQAQLKANCAESDSLAERKLDKQEVIWQTYKAHVAKYDSEIEEYRDCAEKDIKDFSDLQEKAQLVEEMKGYVKEYRRMENLQTEVDELHVETEELSKKIDKARELPGEILESATLPIGNLTVENGIPLINGLPISNLSEGEKLDLCIDVAIQNPKGLQIILIDGVEKLSTKLREQLYAKCKDKGLQFIATRTTDDSGLTVVEL